MVLLGMDVATQEPIHLSHEARRQGVYVIGTTGTGKTTLLKNIVVQDMNDPQKPGVCVLDPHGDMVDELLALVPAERERDVILFAPGDRSEQYEQPLGFNILGCNRSDERERELVASTVISTLYKLFYYSWGPRMEDLLRNSILTLMEKPNTTLLDLWLLLASQNHRVNYYTQGLNDPFLESFWRYQFGPHSYHEKVEMTGAALNKISRFLANPVIRLIVSQPQNAFDMRSVMDEGKILLVNLSKGDLGEDNSGLLGAVLVNLVLTAALSRRDTPPEQRRPFHLIVDEYQSFATETFPTLQSEARKYGITMLVAHQYRDQLDELNKGSTLNVANLIVLRISGADSPILASQFDNTPPEPELMWEQVRFELKQMPGKYRRDDLEVPVPGPRRLYSDVAAERANQLSVLPNYRAYCRLVEGQALDERVVQLYSPDERLRDTQRAHRIRLQSKALGTPRAQVEAIVRGVLGRYSIFDEPPPAV